MDINKLEDQLINSIAEGLVNKYINVKNTFAEDGLYAYVLFCSSGFYAMSVATSTKQSLISTRKTIKQSESDLLETLKDQPDLVAMFTPSSELYAEMTASEWEYIDGDIPEFESLDTVVSDIYEYSYTEADENFNVSKFLTSCVLTGIHKFKNLSSFDDRLLTGIQFGDPSEQEIEIVEKVSAQVNSTYWHEKIKEQHREQQNS